MAGNPFNFNKPVRPENFGGRHTVVNEIADDLCDPGGDSYGIVGGRRFGKSSLLRALEYRLIQQLRVANGHELMVLPVFISLKAIEPSSYSNVLGLLVHMVHRATSGVRKPLPLSGGPLLELGLPEYTEVNPTSVNLQECEASIECIVRAAYEKLGNVLRIALLIDEVDCVLDFPWTGTLFGMLRSLVHDGPVRHYVRLVLAGSGRYLDVDEKGSPLLNAVKACFLEPFAEESARELINRASEIPCAVADEVIRQGAGHPFILQYLLHYLVEAGISSATKKTVYAAVRRFEHDRASDLEGWWYAIGRAGRRVYCTMTKTADWMTYADLARVANDPYLQLDRGLRALCYHGLATHDGTFRKFRATGQLFGDWALSRCSALKRELSSEEHRISERVTQVADTSTLQLGQVSGGTIVIQRGTSLQHLVEVDPNTVARLRPIVQVLKTRLDREEFRILCFNIGVNYDLLMPGGLEAQAVQLVLSCERAGHLEALIGEIRRQRPGAI